MKMAVIAARLKRYSPEEKRMNNEQSSISASAGMTESVLPKIRPFYFDQLQRFPAHSLIFIAVDRYSLHKIREYRGVCLYCPELPERYDLNFCYHREVWVLYARLPSFSRAMALAQTIQWQGAAHIIVLRVHRDFIRGV
jgi:hypothetical protein